MHTTGLPPYVPSGFYRMDFTYSQQNMTFLVLSIYLRVEANRIFFGKIKGVLYFFRNEFREVMFRISPKPCGHVSPPQN